LLLIKVPWCRFSIIYIFTDNTLKYIQEKAIELFNDNMESILISKQSVFHCGKEIEYGYDINMFTIYNYTTMTTDIHYTCK